MKSEGSGKIAKKSPASSVQLNHKVILKNQPVDLWLRFLPIHSHFGYTSSIPKNFHAKMCYLIHCSFPTVKKTSLFQRNFTFNAKMPVLLNALFISLLLISLICALSTVINADLLCRTCGHSVTIASALKNVKSPIAIDGWNLTILGVETLVQVFRNSAPETFNLVVANGADLKFAGRAKLDDTWFPGMTWRTCICSQCNSHIGWYFQSSKDDFVGLVLDYLIGSEYADTLTKVPLPHIAHIKDEL